MFPGEYKKKVLDPIPFKTLRAIYLASLIHYLGYPVLSFIYRGRARVTTKSNPPQGEPEEISRDKYVFGEVGKLAFMVEYLGLQYLRIHLPPWCPTA